jgi:hypothetical protein
MRNQKYPITAEIIPENPQKLVPPIIRKMIKLIPEIENGRMKKNRSNG